MPPAGQGPTQRAVIVVLQSEKAPLSTREITEALFSDPINTQRDRIYHALWLLQRQEMVQSTLNFPMLKRRQSRRPERIWQLNGQAD